MVRNYNHNDENRTISKEKTHKHHQQQKKEINQDVQSKSEAPQDGRVLENEFFVFMVGTSKNLPSFFSCLFTGRTYLHPLSHFSVAQT